jgi:hypothetical protein
MKPHALCLDVQGFAQCRRCRKDPTRTENRGASIDLGQRWQVPQHNGRACADHYDAPPVDVMEPKA